MTEKKQKIKIKAFSFLDLLAFKNLVPERKKRIEQASDQPCEKPAVNILAEKLHPARQNLLISKIKEENPTTRTFRLEPNEGKGTSKVAFFRAGQYLSVKVIVNGVAISRPYSISSSPRDALNGYYEITIKKTTDGFVSNYIWDNWKEGMEVECSGPEGHFYYEGLRDMPTVVGLAGGSGVTPFRSMAKSIVEKDLHIKLILIYGSNSREEVIFYDEFKELEEKSKGKIKVIHVISGSETLPEAETGLITSELIKKYSNSDTSSYFICGSQVMYNFLDGEFAKIGLPRKRVRRELFGEIKNIKDYAGFPVESIDKTFSINVNMGGETHTIPAKATESVLVALERAGMAPPARCRSGLCGFCRSQLIKGNVFIPEDSDGRRAADKLYGFIHTCASYPVSDLELLVPRGI